MATKKQKREEALAKREAFLEREREIGLAAQQRDRQDREERAQKLKEIAEEINREHRKVLSTHRGQLSEIDFA